VAVCCSNDLPQLIEQPRVLDGDDGLGGEVLNECNLFLSERTNLSTMDSNHSNKIIIFSIGTAMTVRIPPSSTASTILG